MKLNKNQKIQIGDGKKLTLKKFLGVRGRDKYT